MLASDDAYGENLRFSVTEAVIHTRRSTTIERSGI